MNESLIFFSPIERSSVNVISRIRADLTDI